MADENLSVNPDDTGSLPGGSEQGVPLGSQDPSSEGPLGQAEIDSLLGGAAQSATGPDTATAPSQTSQDAQASDGAPGPMGQADIDRLLGKTTERPASVRSATGPGAATHGEDQEGIRPGDIECLLDQAQRAIDSINSPSDSIAGSGATQFRFQEFAGAPPNSESTTLDLISDVELDLKIELGRTQMHLEDVLRLRRGSVVPLDKLAGDPVDVYVNGRLIARGEVLVLNDNFCVRVAELVAGASYE